MSQIPYSILFRLPSKQRYNFHFSVCRTKRMATKKLIPFFKKKLNINKVNKKKITFSQMAFCLVKTKKNGLLSFSNVVIRRD